MELVTNYPPGVHILDSVSTSTLMEKISHPETIQPLFTQYVKKAYEQLFNYIINTQFDTETMATKSRMAEFHEEGNYSAKVLNRKSKVVCVDLARAGMIPSQLFYESLHMYLPAENLRQDHVYAARAVNEKNEVVGIDISGSKIGGDIDNAHVLIPDPMGATGSTIAETISIYKNQVDGKAKKFITAHLIVTPEYIKKVKTAHPEVVIFALRLDRGLSDPTILESVPGTAWDMEVGLNSHQYIVPGAGGVGELLNNSFI